MSRRLLAIVALLPVGLLGASPHNPGGLPACSHAVYATTTILNNAATVDDEEVVVVTHASVTELYDARGDWGYTAADTAASWTYSGTDTITVLVDATVAARADWTPDVADSGRIGVHTAFEDEAAIDETSERSALAGSSDITAAVGTERVYFRVQDVISGVDSGDGLGLIYRLGAGLGYFDMSTSQVAIEFQQVSPPCRN